MFISLSFFATIRGNSPVSTHIYKTAVVNSACLKYSRHIYNKFL